MTLLAAARDLPQIVMHATKPRSGRPPKIYKHTDDVRRQELRRDHHLIASKLKEMHRDHLGNVCIRCIEHRPKKEVSLSSLSRTSYFTTLIIICLFISLYAISQFNFMGFFLFFSRTTHGVFYSRYYVFIVHCNVILLFYNQFVFYLIYDAYYIALQSTLSCE